MTGKPSAEERKSFPLAEFQIYLRRKAVNIDGVVCDQMAVITCQGSNPPQDEILAANVFFLETDEPVPRHRTFSIPDGRIIVDIYSRAIYFEWFRELLRSGDQVILDYSTSDPEVIGLRTEFGPTGKKHP